MKQNFKFMALVLLGIMLSINQVWAEGTESFSHSSNSTSYGSINWTGSNGESWSASNVRGDQVITSSNKALCFKASSGSVTGTLTKAQASAGIGKVTIKYKFAFSDASKTSILKLTYNGKEYTIINKAANSMTVGTVYTAEVDVNASGAASATTLQLTHTGTGRTVIDDLSWTSYSAATKTTVLTWSIAGDTSTKTNGTVGTQLTESLIPANPEDLSCGTFVGWSATNPGNESESMTTTEPSDLFTKTKGTKPTPASEAVTYYAIFRKEQ